MLWFRNTSNLSQFLTKSACFKTLKNVSHEASTTCSDLVDDGDNDHLTPSRNKRKSQQKYKDSYRSQWPCLHSSQKVECRAHCSVCKTDFSCKYAGKNDCQRHSESKTYQQLLKTRKSNMSMTSFVAISSTEVEQQRSITRAEEVRLWCAK
jgi:hypothetical protein